MGHLLLFQSVGEQFLGHQQQRTDWKLTQTSDVNTVCRFQAESLPDPCFGNLSSTSAFFPFEVTRIVVSLNTQHEMQNAAISVVSLSKPQQVFQPA